MTVRLAKAAWIGVTVFVLLVTLYSFDGKPNSDSGIFLAWAMLFLSFPSGGIFALLFSMTSTLLYEHFSITIYTTYLSLLLSWTGFFVCGYLQWFKLVPYLITKLRALKKKTSLA